MKTTFEDAADEFDNETPNDDEVLKCNDCGQWKCVCVELDEL